jgi:hypothetical protein
MNIAGEQSKLFDGKNEVHPKNETPFMIKK